MSVPQPVECVCAINITRAKLSPAELLSCSTKAQRKRLILRRSQPVCEGEFYTCRGCKRRAPWCFGASDDMPDHCDDCWAAVHRAAP